MVRPRLTPGQREVLESTARYRVVVAGRRWGKTRMAAVAAIEAALAGQRVWWVAPTYDLARAGWDTLLYLAQAIPWAEVRLADRMLRLGRGAVWVRSADRPQNLRAHGIDLLILDEAAFLRADVWQAVMRPSLADRQGRAIIISTPLGRNWFYDLVKAAEERPGWAVWHYTTADNPHIPPEEIAEMEATMPPRAFRQEVLAEFVADHEGTLWRWEWLERPDFRLSDPPDNLIRVVVGVDPAASDSERSAETGIVVVGLGQDGYYYVLGDYSVRGAPEVWVPRVARAYDAHRADSVVVEINQGGKMVRALFDAYGLHLPIHEERATEGKRVRAEPVAALYERGLVHHIGVMRELEAQLTGWVPGDPVSPDRLDALVWAITYLMRAGRARIPVKARVV